MADGDDEIGPEEQVHLAELDGLGLVQIAGRLQHHEGDFAVAFELGPLMAFQGVFDGEFVQPEQVRDVAHLGFGRTVEPDPGHSGSRSSVGDDVGH